MSEQPTMDQLVATYIKIRDRKALVVAEKDAIVKKLDENLDTIEAALLRHCRETGQEGGKTSAGTFTRTVKTRYWTDDWASMGAYIVEHNVPDLFEKRLAQGNVKTYLLEHPDVQLPGLNVESEYKITVRKPS